MESEVGKFLREKIEQVDNQPCQNPLLPSSLDLSSDCRRLQELISDKEISDLHILYQLYNVISGWQKLIQDEASFLNLLEFSNTNREWLKKTINDIENLPVISQPPPETLPSSYRWSSPSPPNVHGIEDRIKIMERLLDREHRFNAIGLVGMAGVGKTTLCQVAFTNHLVKKNYLPRIWVSLSKLPHQNEDEYLKEVVKRMLNCLGFIVRDEARKDLRVMIKLLRQQLKGKRYLIVLDDPWKNEFFNSLTEDIVSEDQCEQLVYRLPKGDGGAMIVTTRYEQVAEAMVGKKNVVRVDTLPVPDKKSCWNIFDDALKRSEVKVPEDMKMIEDEIVNNCAQLPLVAKMMGKIVCDKLEDLNI